MKEFQYTGKDPEDLYEWSHSKRLDFERKKLMKVQEFFHHMKGLLAEDPANGDNFLSKYSEGEIFIYSDMLAKMVSSKQAEVYKRVVARNFKG